MKKIEFYEHYNIATKTQTIVENDKVVEEHKFEQCPYVWFAELKKKIDAGLVKWVMWKRYRFVFNN